MKIFILCFLFILSGCSVFGVVSVSEPAYQVVKKEGNIEVRNYQPYLIAETTVSGDYDEISSIGFKRLFNYISGNNRTATKIDMTAPVIQNKNSQKIPMTAPVLQQQSKNNDSWKMAFVLPEEYNLKTAPQPLDEKIKIKLVPARTVAVIQYSGLRSEEAITENKRKLFQWIRANNLKAIAAPKYAGYNPPWTLPFLRRNEVQIAVE